QFGPQVKDVCFQRPRHGVGVAAVGYAAGADIVEDPCLPETWWAALRNGLDSLAAHTTNRVALEQGHLSRRVREVYGSEVDTRVPGDAWACAHGDLGYANLTGPELVLLDWESWGWRRSVGTPLVGGRLHWVFPRSRTGWSRSSRNNWSPGVGSCVDCCCAPTSREPLFVRRRSFRSLESWREPLRRSCPNSLARTA